MRIEKSDFTEPTTEAGGNFTSSLINAVTIPDITLSSALIALRSHRVPMMLIDPEVHDGSGHSKMPPRVAQGILLGCRIT